MRRVASLAIAVILVVSTALGCPAAEQGFTRLASADAEIAYRWDPADLRIGRFFAAEVVACRTPGDQPIEGIAIDATMPAHGHGMNYRPSVMRIANGHYRFTGLMLHMPGIWRITVDLRLPGRRTRLSHDVKLAQ